MFKFAPIDKPNKEANILLKINSYFFKLGGLAELIIILIIWAIIFADRSSLGGFTRQEIITYLITGNIISFIASYFLHHIISHDLVSNNSKLLVYKPFKYFIHIFSSGFTKSIFTLTTALLFHALIIYLFLDNFFINSDIDYILLILLMIILAFIIEFLIAYLINMHIFWTIESYETYNILIRLKKILAGNYFPLSFLPSAFLSGSLVLPFAYSTYVPTQLYLKKISIEQGFVSVFIQIIWIIILYVIIKIIWDRKIKKQVKEAKIKIK